LTSSNYFFEKNVKGIIPRIPKAVKLNIDILYKGTIMSNWSLATPPTYHPTAVATASGWTDPITGEVLVTIRALTTKNVDALVVPTFTMSVPANASYGVGATLEFHVIPSEAVTVSGFPSLDITIGTTVRQAVYDAVDSTGTLLIFKYVLVAGDTDANGIVVSNTIDLNTTGYGKSRVVDQVIGSAGQTIAGTALTYTVPVTTGIITTA
jgi:6,7-dimethyl-8-ribityllumazine synthase